MQAVFLDISALGFNLPALIAQLINFLLLLLIFRVLLYKPLLKMLDERKKRIQEGLDASDEASSRRPNGYRPASRKMPARAPATRRNNCLSVRAARFSSNATAPSPSSAANSPASQSQPPSASSKRSSTPKSTAGSSRKSSPKRPQPPTEPTDGEDPGLKGRGWRGLVPSS